MNKLFLLTLLSFNAFSHVHPEIRNGEVKISYPCEILDSLPKAKEEKEQISFFELGENALYHSGYILRKRESEEASDFTLKFRSKEDILVKEDIYQALLSSLNGEFKCEYDLTYKPDGYGKSKSCSFKSETPLPVAEHFDFVRMLGIPLLGDFELHSMREVQVSSTSWKLKLTRAMEAKSPFAKKISIERWVREGECRLEVSGKFESPSRDLKVIDSLIKEGLSFLQSVVKATPSEEQGNKTAWVLGVPGHGFYK